MSCPGRKGAGKGISGREISMCKTEFKNTCCVHSCAGWLACQLREVCVRAGSGAQFGNGGLGLDCEGRDGHIQLVNRPRLTLAVA